MKARLPAAALFIFLGAALLAQRPAGFKPTAQGFFFLPVTMGNPVFDNLADVLGQVDATFQAPVYKGLGVGLGINASFYELNEHGLATEITDGGTTRMLYYGKLFWTHTTGKQTFMEINAKLGQSTWAWDCTTCASNERQTSFHWGANAAWFIHATDNLAFGLSLGYQADDAWFGPGVIGLQRFPGRTDMGAPYRFLTVGLGFSTGFEKSKEGIW
ncbi:MAG: hypothetical protein JST38_21785 [Bacteroidetes bacterium]|nr:hypothetical protein [Bacteroidota bacterium]MBS1943504.1 hypothetical protein [Bacteroidota bacterium]